MQRSNNGRCFGNYRAGTKIPKLRRQPNGALYPLLCIGSVTGSDSILIHPFWVFLGKYFILRILICPRQSPMQWIGDALGQRTHGSAAASR